MSETLIQGRYRLGEQLGSGGVARVFRARDELLGVERAVKLLHGHSDAQTRARLVREAQLMAALRHPAVLHVYDVGVEESGDFVVMDLAEGGSLADRLDRSGPLPPAEAILHLRRLLSALDAAHAAGIVHRDVKPQNILLDHEGQALLADFGIARAPSTDEQRTTRTSVGMGSLCFMAPEQRLDAKNAGPTADIYAAGCTLYALLCDENPIDLFTAEADSDRWLPIPPSLRPVLVRATRHKPEDRYPSAAAMAEALDAVDLGAAPPTPRPSGGAPRVPTLVDSQVPKEQGQKRRWLALGAALALPAALWLYLATDREPAPADTRPSALAAPPAPAPDAPSNPTPPPPSAPPEAPAAEPPAAKARPKQAVKAAPSADSAVAGAWTLSFNGRPARLSLDGTDAALRGVVTTYLNAADASGVSVSVEGRYDAARRTLALVDIDQTQASGSYTLHMSSDGESFTGSFDRADGTYKAPLTGFREAR